MTAFIDARTRRMRDLFDGRRRFIIPRFQRPYAWTTDEAGALLSDIDAARRRSESNGGAGGWFIGSLVLAREGSDQPEVVVDGHQRLTTLTILLAALRDLEGPRSRLRMQVMGGGGWLRRGGRRRDATLALRAMDAEFFYEAVQKPGAILALPTDQLGENDAQNNVIAVALMFRERLGAMSATERSRLALFALERTFVIEVVADDEEQAYRLFSVLNARGKDLKPGDVLKSELLSVAPAAQRARLADQWEATEAALGERRFGALFSHIRTIATERKRERAVFAEIRDAMDPLADPVRFIEREIAQRGAVYRDIAAASLPLLGPAAGGGEARDPQRAPEANRLLRSLRRARNRDWEPAALAYFSRTDAHAPEEALAFLQALERRAYVLLLTGADENARVAAFRPALQAIKAGAPEAETRAALDSSETEKRIARDVLDGPIGAKDRARMPVLLRLDDYLGDGSVDYDAIDATVEHVLPRNPAPESEWLQLWPAKADRKRWVHRLGNLALLPRRRNASAANLDFERKKREYIARGGATPFAITAQVIHEPLWTLDVVRRRQERLAGAARRLWRL